MPRFAANLSMLWPELPILERLGAAAEAGFRHIEILRPDELDRDALVAELRRHQLDLVLFNTQRGPFPDDLGTLAVPGREVAFRDTIDAALDLAAATGTKLLHVIGGAVPPNFTPDQARATAVNNLRALAPNAAAAGVTLLLENINAVDRPGDPFPTPEVAAQAVEQVAHPAVGLQFDFFHAGRAGLDPIAEFRRFKHLARHVQIADAPGRHEPGTGTLPVTPFLQALDASGYAGCVGLEYGPASGAGAGLDWLSA
jgi:hydroxypyruvate isomerase